MLLSLGRLSVRDLWISYQLLLVISLLGVVGLAAPLAGVWLPRLLDPTAPVAALPQALTWYGISLGIASVVVAVVAARSMAVNRTRGTAAWLLTAPVSRASFFVGWMFGVSAAVLAGMVVSAMTAWFTFASLGAAADAARFLSAVLAATAYLVAAGTIGLVCGSAALTRVRASIVAAVAVAALAVAAWVLPLLPWLPSAATVRFNDLVIDPAGVGIALQLFGASIVLIGIAGYVGTALLDRAEL